MVEIIYMMILIAYVFLALIVPASAIKWLISISVFFLMRILRNTFHHTQQNMHQEKHTN